MARAIHLIGLDCGSTTTSAVVARALLTGGAMGRMEVSQLEPIFRSEMVFTPFVDEQIDAAKLATLLDGWLAMAGVEPADIFGGGALVTGLAAQRTNVATVTSLVEARLKDSVVAAADDPCLESWLAFMGNCHALSKTHPDTPILNLDIGGGTTNLALGLNGQVIATGCLFVGARHFQFVAGTHELTKRSAYAIALCDHLGIRRASGERLEEHELNAVLDWYVGLIEAAATGDEEPFNSPVARMHVQVPLRWPRTIDRSSCVITLSGGVGQMAYQALRGDNAPGITQFGDLGAELASRIVRSPRLATRIGSMMPDGLGRATVYGLLKHGIELSGSTLYLSRPDRLPLAHVPVVGRIDVTTSEEMLREIVDLAARSEKAACVQMDLAGCDRSAIRTLAERVALALESRRFPRDRVLVLLAAQNIGKVLGNYITRWGTREIDLIVIDEVPLRDAQFVRLGRLCEGTLGVSLYGMGPGVE